MTSGPTDVYNQVLVNEIHDLVPAASELTDLPLPDLIAHWNQINVAVDGQHYSGTAYGDLGWQIARRGSDGAAFLESRLATSDSNQIATSLDYLPFTCLDPTHVLSQTRPFLDHQSGHVRTSAIDGCRHLHDRDSIEHIRPLLDDPEWLVQNAALSYLVWAEPEAGVAEAVARLKDPHPHIREHAIDLIDELEDLPASDGFWDAILPLIGDDDSGVRAAARWYLISRLDRALPDQSNLLVSPVEWLRAVHAASLAESDGLLAVRYYLNDPAPIVRLNVVESLANVRNRHQLHILLAANPDLPAHLLKDPDPLVREASLELVEE